MINRLNGMRCYLAGAMDRVKDGGVVWRARIREDLKDLDIKWLDPTRKPTRMGLEDDESRAKRRDAKSIGDFQVVSDFMKPIRKVDLRMVDIADFLIVNIDLDVHATGTYEETTVANRQKKPVIFHIEQGVEHAPDWLFAAFDHEMMFGSWLEVHQYLWHVAHARKVETFDRWMFFEGLRGPSDIRHANLKRRLSRAIDALKVTQGLLEITMEENRELKGKL